MSDKKIMCPLMQGPCLEDGKGVVVDGKAEVHACRFWIRVDGRNPQGGEIHAWDCSFAWLPVLLIENSKVNRETGAAVESMRNENVSVGQLLTGAIQGAVTRNAALHNGDRYMPPPFSLPPEA